MSSLLTTVAIYALICLLGACLFIALFSRDAREELTRDSDAEELRRQVQGAGVHGQAYGRDRGARS